MKIHQSVNKIIVTELNPMSDVPTDGSLILAVSASNKRIGTLHFNKSSNMFITSDGRSIHEDKIIGWIPMPVYDPSAKSPEDRYEKLRKLNPRQFDELYARNLRGENFDKMVDNLK